MGKAGAGKVEVTEFYMSQHLGVCCGPVDAFRRIVIKEKVAWQGRVTSLSSVLIQLDDLFGGATKEGGATGTIHFLPGAADQLLPDDLAQRLGRANGADCPGYRGIASVFFTGRPDVNDGVPGFYWTANSPYLPTVEIEVERAPVGLDPDIAMVPRTGAVGNPVETQASATNFYGIAFSPNGRFAANVGNDGSGFELWDLKTRTIVSSGTLPGPWAMIPEQPGGLDSSGNYWNVGSDGVNAGFRYGGLGGTTFVPFTGSNPIHGVQCLQDAIYGLPFIHYVVVRPAQPDLSISHVAQHFFADMDGNHWVVGEAGGAQYGLTCVLGPRSGDSHIFTHGSAVAGAFGCYSGGAFVLHVNNSLIRIDPASFAIIASNDIGVSGSKVPWINLKVGASTIWLGFAEYSLTSLALVRDLTGATWDAPAQSRLVYDAYGNTLIGQPYDSPTPRRFFLLDRGEGDANPAHMIYECLIEDMGAPPSAIDFDSFSAAAQTLYDEGFGLSMMWSRQSTVETFINEIIDHIQATLFVHPRTGLLTLKLIRADYDVATLREITIDNADLTNFQRKAWGEITNEIVVTWTNPDNEQEETVTVQDLAGIAAQNGAIISNGRNYYGVRTSALAMKLAVRDLRISAAPLASCDVELDRTHWDLLPGEVVKVTWAEHGLNQVVMRVGPVDYGRPGEPVIKAPLVEDVFSFDTADYTDPPGTAWSDDGSQPEAMTFSRIITTPAYFAAALLADAGMSAAYPEVLAAVLASSSNPDTFNYDVLGPTVRSDATVISEVQSTNTLLGHALLTAALPAEAQSAAPAYSTPVGMVRPGQNIFVFIGTDSDGEDKMEVALITLAGSDVVWARGLLDTVPRAWPIGTPLWFLSLDSSVTDLDLKADGETVSYKLLTRTSLGVLDAASAPTVSTTMSDRPYLPNRPTAITIGGVQFNTATTPVDMTSRSNPWVTVSWANRNRLFEDGVVAAWTDGTMTPETGQTTTVTVLAADGITVLATHAGLTGTSFDIPDASFGIEPVTAVRVAASRTDSDGTFDSLQSHQIYVSVRAVSFDSTAETFDTTAHRWDEN